MDNHLDIYQRNTMTLGVYVGPEASSYGVPDLTLYTPYLTIKKKATDASTLLSKVGAVSDPSTTYVFNLTSTDTSIAPGNYCYDVTMESPTLGYHTIIKDTIQILESVRL